MKAKSIKKTPEQQRMAEKLRFLNRQKQVIFLDDGKNKDLFECFEEIEQKNSPNTPS